MTLKPYQRKLYLLVKSLEAGINTLNGIDVGRLNLVSRYEASKLKPPYDGKFWIILKAPDKESNREVDRTIAQIHKNLLSRGYWVELDPEMGLADILPHLTRIFRNYVRGI